MWIGWIEFDILLGEVFLLKEKRAVVRPLVNELRRRFDLAAAETGDQDLLRRTHIGIAAVAGDRPHLVEVLDAAERLVAAHPELELLSTRRRLSTSEDEETKGQRSPACPPSSGASMFQTAILQPSVWLKLSLTSLP
ncbi:DUF503 family protein [Paenarthrobacter sp. Z7-10]|nr:DUF503 family protein [Paenarthrobacter sp. Z7-10]